MNIVKDYVTIHLSLIWIVIIEVVTLLITYLVEYVFQTNRRHKFSFFNMIIRKDESETLTKKFHANVNVNLLVKKCSSNQNWNNNKYRCECKNPKKNVICVKSIIYRILKHSLVKMVNILKSIMSYSVITCEKNIQVWWKKTVPTKLF